jgi:hypothetical protein
VIPPRRPPFLDEVLAPELFALAALLLPLPEVLLAPVLPAPPPRRAAQRWRADSASFARVAADMRRRPPRRRRPLPEVLLPLPELLVVDLVDALAPPLVPKSDAMRCSRASIC